MWARQFVGRIAVARRTRQALQSDSRDVASRRQDSETGRLRRLIASCGIERWDQRAGELATVLRKHWVVVSRWVSDASRIRSEHQAFADELDALDRAMAKKAIERLADFRASERER
jgi:predicted membrane GTPase involved in stress response